MAKKLLLISSLLCLILAGAISPTRAVPPAPWVEEAWPGDKIFAWEAEVLKQAPELETAYSLGLEEGFAPRGDRKVLVIFVDFPDEEGGSQFTPAQIWEQIFDPSIPNSLTNYFLENSFGAVNVISGNWPSTPAWLRLPEDRSFYGQDSPERIDVNLIYLIRDALAVAINNGLNLADYDSDGDNVVDHLMIVHAGTGQEYYPSTRPDYLWSCWASAPAGYYIYQQGQVMVRAAVIVAEYSSVNTLPIGTYAHEFFHDLGAPDLYRSDSGPDPVGWWDLMAYGNYGGYGECPTHISGFLKAAAGWLEPVPLTESGYLTFDALSSGGEVYRVDIPGTQEYFLLENRTKVGFDQYIPQEGLVIWHIDGSRPLGTWMIQTPNADGNFAVWVEEPTSPTARKSNAPFNASGFNIFSDSLPNAYANALAYDGTPSNFLLKEISAAGPQMTATAVFTDEHYELTLNFDPGQGAVTAEPAAPYLFGDFVTLQASGKPGWYFSHWEGAASGSANPLTILIDGDKAVTAVFYKQELDGDKSKIELLY